MKIVSDAIPMGLRLTNDRESTELLMELDQQLDLYSFALREGNEVQPLGEPVRRRPGETDDTFYDRACAMATRLYLNHLTAKIETMSRYERMQPMIAKVKHHLNHMELTTEHWDNTEPTEEELDQLEQLCFALANLDETLSELS